MQHPTPQEAKSSSKMRNIVRSGKTFLYIGGLLVACITGYIYGSVVKGFNISYSYSVKDAPPDVSRSLQDRRYLPFGICDEGDDCTAISADDITIVSSTPGSKKLQIDDQKSRRATIRRFCRKYGSLTSDQISDDTLKRLLVDEKHRAIYCSIPKAGCTNWKRLLMAATNDSIDMKSISKFSAHHNKILETLYNYPEYERNTILKSYKKFTFVRNPFIRLLSAYKDKFESLWLYRDDPNGKYFRRYAANIMTKYRANATDQELETGENVTWSEFILYVTHLKDKNFNEHWQPMYKLCDPCQIDYDFVGRIETIDKDATYLLNKVLKLKHQTTKFPNYFDFATNSSEYTYRAYGDITLQQLRLLWDIYKWDFELFGYDKPDFI